MNEAPQWTEILRHINAVQGQEQKIIGHQSISGGDISSAYRLSCSNGDFFIKINQSEYMTLFESEFNALSHMRKFSPLPICVGSTDQCSYIVLEFIPLTSTGSHTQLARLVAELHSVTSDQGYGWPTDNFIGLSPQKNTWHSSWRQFWWSERLEPQFDMAFRNGYQRKLKVFFEPLREAVSDLLKDHQPPAALLHGDLWSGNKGFATGKAYIFDPASYYGDPETDLAMTRLFGGFNREFYTAYHEIFPILPGHERREHIYQLYHLLNHLNLFGDSYLRQCIRMIQVALYD